VIGVPSKLKTDNTPAYTCLQFKEFCKECNTVHVTGLPYYPQGQDLVERAHRTFKTQLLKNKKGGTPQDTLALIFFTLNFLNLPQGDSLTVTDKHFGKPPSLPDIQILIWYKFFNSCLPVLLLKRAKFMLTFLQMDPPKHYGLVFGASGPGKPMNMSNKVMTVPQRETPKDEQMEQTTYKMHALSFKKKCSHLYYVKSSIPTWGQIKALSEKDENILQFTHSSITLENLFLAVVVILTCTSMVSGQVYWAFIYHPPLLRLVEWSERGPIVFTNNSTYLPPLWKSTGPKHPLEEGIAMNISLRYEILPLCIGHPTPCLPVSIQTWPNIMLPT
jgi:hypothetical protein